LGWEPWYKEGHWLVRGPKERTVERVTGDLGIDEDGDA
jgi:hypothetical protein